MYNSIQKTSINHKKNRHRKIRATLLHFFFPVSTREYNQYLLMLSTLYHTALLFEDYVTIVRLQLYLSWQLIPEIFPTCFYTLSLTQLLTRQCGPVFLIFRT